MAKKVCIVYNQDAEEWSKFLLGRLIGSSPLIPVLDSELSHKKLNDCAAFIVIVSPGHWEYLMKTDSYNYHEVVKDASKAVLFMCGMTQEDMNNKDMRRNPISNRFPKYERWATFQMEQHQELVSHISRIQPKISNIARPCLSFQMIPTSASCTGSTTVTLSFSDDIEDKYSLKSKVEVRVHGDEDVAEVPVKCLNEKTVYFTAPVQRGPGKAKVEVTVEGFGQVGTACLNYHEFEPPVVEMMLDITQVYINQLQAICSHLIKTYKMSAKELDDFLVSTTFSEPNPGLSTRAAEQIFGIYKSVGQDIKHKEVPTLLHLANDLGLKKFENKLADLPDARLAQNLQTLGGFGRERVWIDAKNPETPELYETIEDYRIKEEDISTNNVQGDSAFCTKNHSTTSPEVFAIAPPLPLHPRDINSSRCSAASAISIDSIMSNTSSNKSSVYSSSGIETDDNSDNYLPPRPERKSPSNPMSPAPYTAQRKGSITSFTSELSSVLNRRCVPATPTGHYSPRQNAAIIEGNQSESRLPRQPSVKQGPPVPEKGAQTPSTHSRKFSTPNLSFDR